MIVYNEKFIETISCKCFNTIRINSRSATDATIHKKIFGSGHLSNLALHTRTLIILNEEMNDIIKIVKPLEESGLLIKGVSKTNKNKAKKGEFLIMLLGKLGASL